MKFIALCVFVFSCLCFSQAAVPTLYSIVTEFGGQDTETIMYTVKIDLTNGSVTNIVENFIYAGGSMTYDGISAFDPRRLVFYYATDSDNAYVFQADLKNAKLLPPIDFYSRGIINLNYDPNKDRLLVSMFDSKLNPVLISFPQVGPFAQLLQFPTVPQFDRATVDSNNQYFYWTSYRLVNNSFAYKYLSKIPLDNPNKISSVQLKCPLPNGQVVWPQKMIWDSKKRQLYSIGVSFQNQNLFYWIEKIDMSGSCQQIPLQVTTPGIITAYTYDQTTGTIYYSIATNGGGYIFEADVNTGKLKSNGVHVGMQLIPESIEFAYT